MQLVEASRDIHGRGEVKSPSRVFKDTQISVKAGTPGILAGDTVIFEHGRKNSATMMLGHTIGEGDITHV